MTNPLSRIKSLFGEAVDLPGEARQAFLDQQCDGDAELRAAVMALLESHQRATGFLDRPTAPPFTAPAALQQLGPYRLLRVIGEGGFGTVYEAQQEVPVRRTVAVKVLKPGMDSKQILARFDAERQALALMDHPNIARVLDAGSTPDGRPFFVMELVQGVPVTQYCDANRLAPRQRLGLFVPICQAVHHAHQKGIIHRDIKPTNILVAEHDGKPLPKVIDFGVAKAMQHARLGDFTVVTELRQLIGTPEYMSPEQAGEGLDVDIRSDVYSLGVLLYELLSGATPFDSRTLRSAALAEMARLIREVEPPRPSTRLSQIAKSDEIAVRRGTEIARLRGQIRGDLDWIVMKCLEKERSRRYESAAALAADLDNHLSNRPVVAGPPTNWYRFQKFVRRNRLPLSMAAVVMVALLAGFVATLIALRQARVERDSAVLARAAEAEARIVAEQHVGFVQDMFQSIRPETARGRSVTVREILDASAGRVQGAFRDRPLSEAAVHDTFGVAYAGLGLADRSLDQFDRAVALAMAPGITPNTEWLLNLQTHRVAAMEELGRNADAEALARKTIEESTRHLGPDHVTTLSAMDRLASVLYNTNRLQEAEAIRAQVEKRINTVASQDPRLAFTHAGNYATLLQGLGRLDEAEAIYRRELQRATAAMGEDHPDVIGLESNLSGLLRDRFRFADALQMAERALAKSRRVFGEDHPNTLVAAHQTALLMSANGRSKEAESVLTDAIARCRRVLGEDHRTTLFARHNLVQIQMVTGRGDEAMTELEDIISRMKRTLGEDHRDTLMMRADLAKILQAHDLPGSEAIYRDVTERLNRTLGPDHFFTVSARMRLGLVLGYQQKYTEAEPILAAVYAQKKASGEGRKEWAAAVGYGAVLARTGKYREAIDVLHEAEAAIKTYPRLDRSAMATVASSMVMSFDGLGEPDKAEPYRKLMKELSSAPSGQPHTTSPAGTTN